MKSTVSLGAVHTHTHTGNLLSKKGGNTVICHRLKADYYCEK